MIERFKGRVVTVSGAAQGIERVIAERLGAEGATVIAVDQNGKGLQPRQRPVAANLSPTIWAIPSRSQPCTRKSSKKPASSTFK
jgi:NAD(P)-dependent dehydrogenase (short-subunit alcohol dehydrogenase family)